MAQPEHGDISGDGQIERLWNAGILDRPERCRSVCDRGRYRADHAPRLALDDTALSSDDTGEYVIRGGFRKMTRPARIGGKQVAKIPRWQSAALPRATKKHHRKNRIELFQFAFCIF